MSVSVNHKENEVVSNASRELSGKYHLSQHTLILSPLFSEQYKPLYTIAHNIEVYEETKKFPHHAVKF